MRKHFAIPLGLFALGLAAQSSAVTFRFQFESPITVSSGIYSVTSSSLADIVNLTSTGGQTATALTYAYTPGALGNFTNGAGKVTSTVGTLNFTFLGNNTSTGMNGTLVTLSGGTGAYVGFGGTGVISHTINNVNPNFVDGQFFADVQAVPEPTSMLALGVGGLALIRRRNRRAAR